MKLFDFMDHLDGIKNSIDNKNKKDFFNKLKQIYNYYKKKEIFDKWKNAIAKKQIFKKLLRIRKKELEKKKNFTIDSNVNNIKLLQNDDDKNNLKKLKNNEITISNENNINITKKESPPKILSIGNPGLDFSIIAPDLYYINDVEPGKKMPKSEKMNEIIDQVKKMNNFFNNMKLKKCLDDWKNRKDLKKILNNLKKYKDKDNKIKSGKNKILNLLKNKLNKKIFGGLNNDHDEDLLGKAFKIWKNINMYFSKTQNATKLKIKLVRSKIDEGTQINLDNNNYSI